MSGENFDIMVVANDEDFASFAAELAKLIRTYKHAYKKVNEGRGWVKWHFTGTVAEGGVFPQDYMDVHNYLVGEGFEITRTDRGERCFEKD
ncbi:hypothetical protein E5D57_009884 [Metarhizium anisopliae]|nr:hypothetical protein E5D57_009884 [Metarhizium anisopliae]